MILYFKKKQHDLTGYSQVRYPVKSLTVPCLVLLTTFHTYSQDRVPPPRPEHKPPKITFSISRTPSIPEEKGPVIIPASYRNLLAKATPAVVSVFASRVVTADNPADNPVMRFFGKESENGEVLMGSGSGVILSADGWIATNSHVVHLATGNQADAINIELSDRSRFPAKIVGVDPATDLALLKIEAGELPTLPIADSDKVSTGDLVFALGNPFQIGMTATMGMVSATRRSNLNSISASSFENFIQTDAAINPGNSGGALIDGQGRLIGINTATFGPGIGLAIPSRLMTRVITILANEGKVTRGFFGLETMEVDPFIAREAGAEKIEGAWVADVMENGPSEKAGLKIGDIIIQADDRKVETRGDLRIELSCKQPGESIELLIFRKGTTETITITGIETLAPSIMFTLDALPWVKFSTTSFGIKVEEIGTPLKDTGDRLQVGMVITDINLKNVMSQSHATDALKKGINKIVVYQKDKKRTLAIRL